MITVAVAGEGRHLFEAIRDPRVRVTSIHETPCPDLIDLPCSRFRRFDNIAALTLPQATREHIARRAAGVIFDSSLEGVPHKPDIAAALHSVMQHLGAVPQQCVYVTADHLYETDYREHCATIGVAPVSVVTHDYWIWASLNEYEKNGAEVFQRRLDAFRRRSQKRERKFVSLNRTPRPTKILFLLRLLHDGLWNDGFISFGGFTRKVEAPGKGRPSPDELRRALPGFEELVDRVAPHLEYLDGLGRVLLGLEQHGLRNLDQVQSSMAVELAEYDRSWFTVITETEMRPRPSRITEKMIKPLVNFHPLLVLGNPESLKMTRDYGFVTFPEIFDEVYDDVLDPRQRFERVYAQVIEGCRRSDEEWQRLQARIEEKLIFNARWGLTEFPSTYRQQRDRSLVDRIVAAVLPGRTFH